jgi:hypothetical protein
MLAFKTILRWCLLVSYAKKSFVDIAILDLFFILATGQIYHRKRW